MKITYEKKSNGEIAGYLSYEVGSKESVIWFGENDVCQTEFDAREAAELLKAFFESKKPEKAVDEKQCLGDRCVTDGECEKRALCWFDPANEWKSTPIPEIMLEGERHKNTVIDQMNEEEPNAYERIRTRAHMKHERRARKHIAQIATQIFAHGKYISREAAIDDAAEIWRLSQKIEL